MTEPAPLHAALGDAPAGGRAVFVTAADGTRLRVAAWAGGDRGTAFVFPGRTEYVEKYGRVVGRLRALGLSAVVIDWRGQGLSARSARAPGLGHVERFAEFQADVAALLAADVVRALPGPRVLVAHSMGGCIGLRTLLARPGAFAASVFSAPMWGLPVHPIVRVLAGGAFGLADLAGFGGRPATRREHVAPSFAANALTTDPEHFAWMQRQVAEVPALALGPPSIAWVGAAFREMGALAPLAPPPMPALVFLGSEETVVSPGAIEAKVPRMDGAKLVALPGARHEVLMERAEVQDVIWRRIGTLLDATLPGPEAQAFSR